MHRGEPKILVASLAVLGIVGMGMSGGNCSGFVAHLSGAAEVDPIETLATGQALFMYSEVSPPSDSIPEGVPPGGPLAGRAPMQINYKLLVSETSDAEDGDEGQLVAAHIHCAPEGQNGPVSVTLFSSANGGVITPAEVRGAITDASIEDNGCPIASLTELLEAMEAGETYVNVHTNAHPSGEIRGQIRGVDPSES
jgi:hypothetical protein